MALTTNRPEIDEHLLRRAEIVIQFPRPRRVHLLIVRTQSAGVAICIFATTAAVQPHDVARCRRTPPAPVAPMGSSQASATRRIARRFVLIGTAGLAIPIGDNSSRDWVFIAAPWPALPPADRPSPHGCRPGQRHQLCNYRHAARRLQPSGGRLAAIGKLGFSTWRRADPIHHGIDVMPVERVVICCA